MRRLMNEIFEKIEEKRKEKKIFKKDLAASVGKDSSWYSKIKSGEYELKLSDFVKMAEFLGVEPEELFPGSSIIDIKKMSLLDMIRHVVRTECGKYCNKFKEVNKE